ncbi:MAG: thiamine pyrophosphate-dependent enzyme [Bacillota bacterium]
MQKILSGNEAVAQAALVSGAKVITGYPGTPSSEVISSLLKRRDLKDRKIEWSTNEKVAFEIAAAAAWAGQRAMCTMKMSGLNVAYDSVIGVAYSGCNGGLVIYVTDDPGVTTGMCEQDSRGFALMSDMVMLEPANVQESYDLVKEAFLISEAIQTPVFVRSVTNVAQAYSSVEVSETALSPERPLSLEKDISRFTKAGPVICTNQHKRLIASLTWAEVLIEEKKLNKMSLDGPVGGLGVISSGVVNSYVPEAAYLAQKYGLDVGDFSVLRLSASVPLPKKKLQSMILHCDTLLVLEELEPHVEREVYIEAFKLQKDLRIIGKENEGVLSRFGEYNAAVCAMGFFAALGKEQPPELMTDDQTAEKLCAMRPITTCAGCPHRGTFMSINKALRSLGYKREEVMICGDIGCTILGMNPPFNTLWTELSMGASIAQAQGFVYSGVKTPVIAMIGDSTFFHAGLPALANAVQQGTDMTIVIMDNGWTAMTGMQVNPASAQAYQNPGGKQIDVEKVVRGLGVDQLWVVDPYELLETTEAMVQALKSSGVKVVLCRRECAIQAARRQVKHFEMAVEPDHCSFCKICINITGCAALTIGKNAIEIDPMQCNGCGICSYVCPTSAISKQGGQI